jgi:hypothetical protein
MSDQNATYLDAWRVGIISRDSAINEGEAAVVVDRTRDDGDEAATAAAAGSTA